MDVDAACSPGLSMWLLSASSQHDGWVPRPRTQREAGGSCTFHDQFWKLHSVTSPIPYSLSQSQSSAQVQKEKKKVLLLDGERQGSGKAHGARNVAATIFGNYVVAVQLLSLV
ncbi:unnamed protein product [Rangifer tarandus platyrhynchus]|uniref:Uncharacterized protein n=1 Tax=Rangifer tarandus platyrhynchus TaxID=3082113 RepID=A0ABN9A9A5_RANTA|nr:unnamed protein product [Rangifer tarandus platyrhynchus]